MIEHQLIILLVVSSVETIIYLQYTTDSSSIEFYDCIIEDEQSYCRRPSTLFPLQRTQPDWHCYNDGQKHSFEFLQQNNISISTIVHEWKSTLEMAENYARYLGSLKSSMSVVDHDKNHLCKCRNPQSFGKHCEYLLPHGTTFRQTIEWQLDQRKVNATQMQIHGDIVCYTSLKCNSGILCLDWREICDGIQQCMFGYDEENCDKIEFNECEHDEYRCTNGMCIPDEYFLDGDYDCSDLSDEKEGFDGAKCPLQEAHFLCDDRSCSPNEWSCGDGQCITTRVSFLLAYLTLTECHNFREQYHMCELHHTRQQWTLSNGKCLSALTHQEPIQMNRTAKEECIYWVKCVLSRSIESNCPCKFDRECLGQIRQICNYSEIRYPDGAIITPYIYNVYGNMHNWFSKLPFPMKINASIKCRGFMIDQHSSPYYLSSLPIADLEQQLCAAALDRSIVRGAGYDANCYSNSTTFNGRPYNMIDVCSISPDCISAYRINDGYDDCAYRQDERGSDLANDSCAKIQRHRFRCSPEHQNCLPVKKLGDQYPDCLDKEDESWMGTNIPITRLRCDPQSKEDCSFIRQYVERSPLNLINDMESSSSVNGKRNPFRTFCDTFWNLGSNQDEDVSMCQRWWKCLDTQWQCRTGQCIDSQWVLDNEWDCSDASDEEALLTPPNPFYSQNLRIINESILLERYFFLYENLSFSTICNLTSEYPCFRLDNPEALNISLHRPCISHEQIGDRHIDCAGAIDERNTIKNCHFSSMLGYYYRCTDDYQCMSYAKPCAQKCVEHQVQCFGYQKASNCSAERDFMCLNGDCAKDSACDRKYDCKYGEDELFCIYRNSDRPTFTDRLYRLDKEEKTLNMKKELNLPQFPMKMDDTNVTSIDSSSVIQEKKDKQPSSLPTAYWCNRGIGIETHNQSIACFCPPQYYGDKCQYHSDRLTVMFQLDLSQSIYASSTDPQLAFRLLIVFLFNRQPLQTISFHVHLVDTSILTKKHVYHLLYSRSEQFLQQKRNRYFNRSNIIDEHPYSVRIEAYELRSNEQPRFIAIWEYPMYFDFLPSYRLVKILRIRSFDRATNPCNSNPCLSHEKCHPLMNGNSSYICLYASKRKSDHRLTKDQQCQENFCASNALCNVNYRGLLSANHSPYCICPSNRYGDRCGLIYDQCVSNPCFNSGQCFPRSNPNEYFCLCTDFYYGTNCEHKKNFIQFYIEETVRHRAAIIQYFNIDFYLLDLTLIHQQLYQRLPSVIQYLHRSQTVPELILVRFYSNSNMETYLIGININTSSINATIRIDQNLRCDHVEQLFPKDEEISPLKYHRFCTDNQTRWCFIDHFYLCICDQNYSRAECFTYDSSLTSCSSCVTGQCVRGDQSIRNDFLCLCPQCYQGPLCQFNMQGFTFTFNALIGQEKRSIRSIYILFGIIIFLFGGLMNLASFLTFKRSTLRQLGISHYLLLIALFNQLSLLSLLVKLTDTIWTILASDLSCRTLSFLMFISTRYTYWLASWVTFERIYVALYPWSALSSRKHAAMVISMVTFCLMVVTHIPQIIFHKTKLDPHDQVICFVQYPAAWIKYDRGNILFHNLVPFSIQILSISISILMIVRRRSRPARKKRTFCQLFVDQYNKHTEVYIIPSIIVLKLAVWQKHALSITIFVSHLPELLGFIIFVLPSDKYYHEFQRTALSQTRLFRWIIGTKVQHKSKNTHVVTKIVD